MAPPKGGATFAPADTGVPMAKPLTVQQRREAALAASQGRTSKASESPQIRSDPEPHPLGGWLPKPRPQASLAPRSRPSDFRMVSLEDQEREARKEARRKLTEVEVEEEKQTKAVETETVICMNAHDKFAEVYTDEPVIRDRLTALGYSDTKESPRGWTFMVPRSIVIFGDKARMTRKGNLRRTSNMSEENRKLAGIRLQTAKASKFGLTIDQYKSLRLRPGEVPDAKAIKKAKRLVP